MYKKYKLIFVNIIVLLIIFTIILIGFFINSKLDFFSFNNGNSVIKDISTYCTKLKNSSNKYIGINQKLLWQAKLNNAKDEYNIWFAKLGLAKAEMSLGGFDEAVSIIEEVLSSENFQSSEKASVFKVVFFNCSKCFHFPFKSMKIMNKLFKKSPAARG